MEPSGSRPHRSSNGRALRDAVTPRLPRSQDPAAVSTRELLRRTPRADHPDRDHRPNADLRRSTPAQCARPVCGALQPEATASITGATSATPGHACPRADPHRDPAAAHPRRLDQRVRGRGLKLLLRRRGRVLAPDRVGPRAGAPGGPYRRGSTRRVDRPGRRPSATHGNAGQRRPWSRLKFMVVRMDRPYDLRRASRTVDYRTIWRVALSKVV